MILAKLPLLGLALHDTVHMMIHGLADVTAKARVLPNNARSIVFLPKLFLKGVDDGYAPPEELERRRKLPEESPVKETDVADYLCMWAEGERSVPPTGSFIGFISRKGVLIPEVL